MRTNFRNMIAAATAVMMIAGGTVAASAQSRGDGGRGATIVRGGDSGNDGTSYRRGGRDRDGRGHAGRRDGFNVRNGFNVRDAQGRRLRPGDPGYNGRPDRFAGNGGWRDRDDFHGGRPVRNRDRDRFDGPDRGHRDFAPREYGNRVIRGPSFSGPSFAGPSFGGGFPDALTIYRQRYGGTSVAVPSPYAQVPASGEYFYGYGG